MVNEEIVGTEIDKEWKLDSEGDLALVRGSDNLSQAIYLRLTAYFNSLKWAYQDYGSYTKDWLGENNNSYNRATLQNEIKTKVEKDPRINSANVQILDGYTPHVIPIMITAYVTDGTTFQEYYIFSDLPRKDDTQNSPNWSNTWIDTRDTGYYGKQGEPLTVHCYVRTKEDDMKVPVGEVSLSIGGYHVDLPNNPQMLAQSGTDDPGGVSFTFTIPRFFKVGRHEMQFKYKGIKGYNNCVGTTELNVVERIPTHMEYVYPTPRQRVYFANDYDDFTDPVVQVLDANEYGVQHGTVRYYLSDYDNDEDYVFVEFPIIYKNTVLITETVYLYCKVALLDYSTKFIFNVDYMFRPKDIIQVVSKEGELIDYLEVNFEYGEDENGRRIGIFFLTSTSYTKPYQFIDNSGVTRNFNNKEQVDTMRLRNTDITMEVLE